MSWQPSKEDEVLFQLALTEDLGTTFCDLTTELLFADSDTNASAYIISKHPQAFVLCGLPLAQTLLQQLPGNCMLTTKREEGDIIQPGEIILSLEGSIKTLLMLERPLLNFLQHLSAIATTTSMFVEKIKHTSLKILDTRKTTPGFRHLAKYAVFCGGGVNHRAGLYDAVLIKDNHIDALGGIAKVLECLPILQSDSPATIIEVRTYDELKQVLEHGLQKINRVLLDNMQLNELQMCTHLCKGKILTEASGNIDLTNILAIAETGVDYASIGKLTHSFKHIDLSMKMY